MRAGFEWDPAKATANRKRHGLSFEEALGAFADPSAIEWRDDREAYGEERFKLLGQSAGRLLVVIYVERNDRVRIISARRASRREHDDYYRRLPR